MDLDEAGQELMQLVL